LDFDAAALTSSTNSVDDDDEVDDNGQVNAAGSRSNRPVNV
jgi:hypothetical protein